MTPPLFLKIFNLLIKENRKQHREISRFLPKCLVQLLLRTFLHKQRAKHFFVVSENDDSPLDSTTTSQQLFFYDRRLSFFFDIRRLASQTVTKNQCTDDILQQSTSVLLQQTIITNPDSPSDFLHRSRPTTILRRQSRTEISNHFMFPTIDSVLDNYQSATSLAMA